MQDRYTECLARMYKLRRFGIKLGLETVTHMLSQLGNPQTAYRCIHIAGTNGKGSVAAALTAILAECGLKTGLYTSPHLVRFNERIRIDNAPVSDNEVVTAYDAVKDLDTGDREPTFFEYATVMALHAFARNGVDIAVIETGMGGRLDATNIVSPEVSVITNISVEHTLYLGNTLAEIAYEKAGIIKPGIPVVTAVKQKPARDAIESAARDRGARLYRRGRDFRTRTHGDGTFSYYGIHNKWPHIRFPLTGTHQVENASLVLAACELLGDALPQVNIDCIETGLPKTDWPGRLQVISRKPLVILDGAHNLMAAKILADYLRACLGDRPLTLVVGILDDKPYEAMLAHLLPLSRRVVVTRPKIDRSLPPETLLPVIRSRVDDVTVVSDVPGAVERALAEAESTDAVCVAGSLYVVGEAMEAMQAGRFDRWIQPASGQ